MLTLSFLGVGSAFAKRNDHSNALLEVWHDDPDRQSVPDENLLIDFGSLGPKALHAMKDRLEFSYLESAGRINYHAIDHIFITHLHADHVGGLEEFGFARMYLPPSPGRDPGYKPRLIAAGDVLEPLWTSSLCGGMGALQGRYAELSDYFHVFDLSQRASGNAPPSFSLGDRYRVEIFRTDHIQVAQKYDWPSYGLWIKDTLSDESVFYSGDTKYDFVAYETMMRHATLCFHEVQLFDQPDPVHSLLSELRSLPREIKSKTWLYHYGDRWDQSEYQFVLDEFAGFARPHSRYTLLK